MAGVAAQRRTAEQLSSLAAVNADILRLAADPSPSARAHRYRILDRQFHGIVHAMAHSPVVAEISRRMWDMSDLIINTSGAPQTLAFAVPARHEDHERVIAALQRADPEGARAEMEAHILGTVAVIHPPAGGPGPDPAQG